ncbi:SWI/SNF chromatin-remodeling complex subunit [Malassezia obtusa]|uniref:SWI/SNF chromatin-remodeling complex subunit n=1 Tax=Malassezia obtusa TaxID=76774 RepID=A0AAF0E1G3_9BASI|nr:SWI/SNF chromatin-remodeling complex subunit [Malassezia obtusa]
MPPRRAPPAAAALDPAYVAELSAARFPNVAPGASPPRPESPAGAAPILMPGAAAYTSPLKRPDAPIAVGRPPGAPGAAGPRRGRPPRNPRPPPPPPPPSAAPADTAGAAPAAYLARPGGAPAAFVPALSAQQQQALMARAVQLSKAQDQPSFTPLHALLQMGFVFVRNTQLPNVPPGAAQGGTILRADEAAALGLLPSQGAGAARAPAAPAAPWQPSPMLPYTRPVDAARPERPSLLRTVPGDQGEGAAPSVPGAMLPGAPTNVPLVKGGAPPAASAVGVPVTLQNTRLTALPSPSTAPYPWHKLDARETDELLAIMRKDAKFQPVLHAQQAAADAELYAHTAPVLHPPAPGKPAHEPAAPRGATEPLKLVLPAQRQRALEQGVRGVRAPVPLSGAEVERTANTPATLVPIRLELDHEPFKLRDTFLWNAAEDDASLEAFAVAICEDIGLPSAVFVSMIRTAVQTQVHEYAAAMALRPGLDAAPDDAAGEARGMLTPAAERVWAQLRHGLLDSEAADAADAAEEPGEAPQSEALRSEHPSSEAPRSEAASTEAPPTEAPPSPPPGPGDELRVLIKLDILVGAQNLVDQFEWDLLDQDAQSAERFAETFAAELGLPGEFKTAIAHAIREQVSTHLRLLFLLGYPFNKLASMDEEVRTAFLPALDTQRLARAHGEVDAFTPKLVQLTPADALLLEREHEREMRRKRRQTKGRRGINLAEREPQRTIRSVPVYGLQGGVPDASSAAALPTRRAAAAAASAHLATTLADDEPPAAPAKRIRPERHDLHFRFPGGLGAASGASAPRFRSRALAQTPLDALGRRAPVAAPVPTEAVSTRGRPPKERAPTAELAPARGARPEDLERQHPNMFDGVWHCGNCGLPGYLAPGRRKGPAGEKTLCGPCGKYYHRHRRMESVPYTRDPAYHIKRLKRAAGSGAADDDEAPDGDAPAAGEHVADMPLLPDESDSDGGDAPAPVPPAWLVQAAEASRQKYPNDSFQIQLRPRPPDLPPPAEEEWRIRCADCPGKVYKPGPGESLINFEIHLKNRSHRAAVARRLGHIGG